MSKTDNPRFNVGDEVVALRSDCEITKGEEFTIRSVSYCPKCGEQDVDIGFDLKEGYQNECGCSCGCDYTSRGVMLWSAKDFALLQNMTAQIEEALKEPVTV